MKEIEANKKAWGQLSHDHYLTFKGALKEGRHSFNPYIAREIGDLTGKRVLHMQCNTGADTLLLAQMAAHATGVDLVPENILYARRLAQDLGIANVEFIESDILKLMNFHNEKYDVVFTSEGAIGWLPDLAVWGRTIRQMLTDDGFFYMFESHPFYMMLDERRLAEGFTEVKYPYFDKRPDVSDTIGGYASAPESGAESYFWLHTIGDIVNALADAGLRIQYIREYQESFYDAGGLRELDNGLWNYGFNDGRFPLSMSIKALPNYGLHRGPGTWYTYPMQGNRGEVST